MQRQRLAFEPRQNYIQTSLEKLSCCLPSSFPWLRLLLQHQFGDTLCMTNLKMLTPVELGDNRAPRLLESPTKNCHLMAHPIFEPYLAPPMGLCPKARAATKGSLAAVDQRAFHAATGHILAGPDKDSVQVSSGRT